MDHAISLETLYNGQPSSKGVFGRRQASQFSDLMDSKGQFKRHLYLFNTFFDTLLEVTIFFYIKWIKKEIVNFPCCFDSFN